MSQLVTPEQVSKHEWLIDLQLDNVWRPGYLTVAESEYQVCYLDSGQRKEASYITSQPCIAPIAFHTNVPYEAVTKLRDGAVSEERLALIITGCRLENFAKMDEIEKYELVNGTLPVTLSEACTREMRDTFGILLEEINTAAVDLLLAVVPRLPEQTCKGHLEWLWPGTLEVSRLLIKRGMVVQQGEEYRDKLKQLQLALTEKLQRLNAEEFAYADVAVFFLIQNSCLMPFALESTLLATAQAAFALQTDFSPDLEQPVAMSLSALLNSMQATPSQCLVHQWVQFLVRFRWTTYSNTLLSALLAAMNLDRDVIAILRTENFFTGFASKVGTFEKTSLMKIMEAAPELFIIPDFFPEVVTTPFVLEIRNHYLFNVIEKRQWKVVERILHDGHSTALLDDKSHHFLLTMALGRSMPYQLVTRFFSARPFGNCHPFQMLATRYPETEQIHLLTHLATRESVCELLSRDAVLKSSAFGLQEVKELLKMVLFRDRMLLLWLRTKVEFMRRVPAGMLRGIALDYIS